jgi:hypothetical protein
MTSLVIMYGLDLAILLLALGGALVANGERRRHLVPRHRLLLPGGAGHARNTDPARLSGHP